jgi:hypothetical protein
MLLNFRILQLWRANKSTSDQVRECGRKLIIAMFREPSDQISGRAGQNFQSLLEKSRF